MFVYYLFIFLFGLVAGSFLNCLIYRLELGELSSSEGAKLPRFQRGSLAPSFLWGRSYCPRCKHTLAWPDLIPLLSFFILRGKCRYCKKPISIQYPLIELAAAILFVLIFWISDFKIDLTFGFWILIACFLLIIFVYDLKHYLIPDKIIYPAIMIALLRTVLGGTPRTVLAGLAAAAFFLAIFLISRAKWLGFGDVKLAFLLGLLLGFPDILVALFLAFSIGAIIGVGLILLKRKTLKSELPFGPFLVGAAFIALFWGEKIINFYLNLFNL